MREACPIFKSWYNQNFKGKIFLAAIWVKHLANCSVYMHGIYKCTLGGWDTEVRPILKEKKKVFFKKSSRDSNDLFKSIPITANKLELKWTKIIFKQRTKANKK